MGVTGQRIREGNEWWVMMKMNQRIRERNDWREGREMTTDGGKNRGEG